MNAAANQSAVEPQWLQTMRKKAGEEYSRLEWPLPDQEEWRRTNLEEFPFEEYDDAPPADSEGVSKVSANEGRVVFDKGVVTEYAVPDSLSESGGALVYLPAVPENKDIFEIPQVKSALEKTFATAEDRFAVWNMSRWSQAAVLYVPDGVIITEPIAVDFARPAEGKAHQSHLLVVLGNGAHATVVHRYLDGDDSIRNAGVSAWVGDGGSLSIASLQKTSRSSTFFYNAKIYLNRDAVLKSFELHTGGKLVKSRIEAFIEGPGADVNLAGIYYVQDGQHMDIKTVQYHRQHHANSRAYYRGAVVRGGRSIYQGMIDVEHEAEGTDAYLTNNNLLLGDGARADSIPCLEIRTNDVKCSHGSTSGKINEEELFYLMSRGIARDDATRELILGYYEESIQKAPEVIRDEIRETIEGLVD